MFSRQPLRPSRVAVRAPGERMDSAPTYDWDAVFANVAENGADYVVRARVLPAVGRWTAGRRHRLVVAFGLAEERSGRHRPNEGRAALVRAWLAHACRRRECPRQESDLRHAWHSSLRGRGPSEITASRCSLLRTPRLRPGVSTAARRSVGIIPTCSSNWPSDLHGRCAPGRPRRRLGCGRLARDHRRLRPRKTGLWSRPLSGSQTRGQVSTDGFGSLEPV